MTDSPVLVTGILKLIDGVVMAPLSSHTNMIPVIPVPRIHADLVYVMAGAAWRFSIFAAFLIFLCPLLSFGMRELVGSRLSPPSFMNSNGIALHLYPTQGSLLGSALPT